MSTCLLPLRGDGVSLLASPPPQTEQSALWEAHMHPNSGTPVWNRIARPPPVQTSAWSYHGPTVGSSSTFSSGKPVETLKSEDSGILCGSVLLVLGSLAFLQSPTSVIQGQNSKRSPDSSRSVSFSIPWHPNQPLP